MAVPVGRVRLLVGSRQPLSHDPLVRLDGSANGLSLLAGAIERVAARGEPERLAAACFGICAYAPALGPLTFVAASAGCGSAASPDPVAPAPPRPRSHG